MYIVYIMSMIVARHKTILFFMRVDTINNNKMNKKEKIKKKTDFYVNFDCF